MAIPPESRLLLAAASRLLPRRLRADWLREWEAEAWWWLNGQPRARSIGTRIRLAAHCRGGFADARFLRADAEDAARARWLRSPAACLALPALLLALLTAASGGLRETRRAWNGAPFPDGGRLAILSQVGPFMGQRLGVPSARLDYWNAQSQSLDGAAIYVPYRSVLSAACGPGQTRTCPTILASRVGPEFFSLLGIRPAAGRVFTAEDAARCQDCAVVTYDFWRRQRGGPPGQPSVSAQGHQQERRPGGPRHLEAASLGSIALDGRSLRVIGVLPRDFRFLQSEPSVWTLQDPHVALLATAVCRLKPGITPQAAQTELRDLIARAGGGIRGTSGAWVTVTPLETIAAGPIGTLVPLWLGVMLVLALYAFAGSRRAFRYRAFWAAKVALALTVVWLAGLESGADLFRIEPGDALLGAGALALWTMIAASGFTIWWSWADQRQRCRECLSRLTMPARMGYGARMLFETGGTELLCPKGHGRLFVSEGASPQAEWTPLDATWRELFPEGAGHSLREPHE